MEEGEGIGLMMRGSCCDDTTAMLYNTTIIA